MDDKALTSDDTRSGAEAEAASQVYEYDAATKRIRRISVGEEGYDDDGNAGTGNAYIVPAFRGGASDDSVPVRLDPTMSANGDLVFFESPIALVPGALNDVPIGEGHYAENVYENYDGHVSLISDGSDTTEKGRQSEALSDAPTELLGVSASGGDVVFSTFDQLVPGDTDTEKDYYDAHICSSEAPCVEPVGEVESCGERGGGCQVAGGGVVGSGVPGSVGFSGPGNLAPVIEAPVKTVVLTRAQLLARALKVCRTKRNRHRRVVCEASARKRYPPAKRAARARKSAEAKRAADIGFGRGGK